MLLVPHSSPCFFCFHHRWWSFNSQGPQFPHIFQLLLPTRCLSNQHGDGTSAANFLNGNLRLYRCFQKLVLTQMLLREKEQEVRDQKEERWLSDVTLNHTATKLVKILNNKVWITGYILNQKAGKWWFLYLLRRWFEGMSPAQALRSETFLACHQRASFWSTIWSISPLLKGKPASAHGMAGSCKGQ